MADTFQTNNEEIGILIKTIFDSIVSHFRLDSCEAGSVIIDINLSLKALQGVTALIVESDPAVVDDEIDAISAAIGKSLATHIRAARQNYRNTGQRPFRMKAALN